MVTYLIRNEMVRLDAINVCSSYQRPVNRTSVNRIKKNFDGDAFGSLTLGVRSNGTYWVVDGQHRLIAAKELEFEKVRCDMFVSDGEAHEARVFRHRNKDRVSVGAMALFRSKLAEQDKAAVDILKTVQQEGFDIPLTSSKAYWPNINCISALQAAYRRGGADNLRTTLYVIKTSWYEDVKALQAVVVGGVSTFVHKYPEARIERLVDRMQRFDASRLLRRADGVEMAGGSRANALARVILAEYNTRLRNKLEDRFPLKK